MPSPLHHIAHRSARKFLNLRLGWQLMRDPQVPVPKKLLAIGFGVCVTILMFAFEIPIEGILAVIAPFVGVVADVAIDGAEMVLLPLLLALAILPYLHREQIPVRTEIQVR